MKRKIVPMVIIVMLIVFLGGTYEWNKLLHILMVQEFDTGFPKDDMTRPDDMTEQEENRLPDKSREELLNGDDADPRVDGGKDADITGRCPTERHIEAADGKDIRQEEKDHEMVEQEPETGKSSSESSTDQSAKQEETLPKQIVSKEKIQEIEKKVSASDKSQAMSIVLKSLKAEDYSELLGLAKDGITEADKQRAIEILKERLTQEQKEQIKGLYGKYQHLLQ